MHSIVPGVHLFICLDPKVAPGPVLQSLDLLRVKSWQQEIVLVCDASWRSYVSVDQPALFFAKDEIYCNGKNSESVVNTKILESLLEQLDSFEITEVTQIGELSWARWLKTYLEDVGSQAFHKLDVKSETSSVELINELSSSLALDVTSPVSEKPRTSAIYVDPYDGDEMSAPFLKLFSDIKPELLPDWLNIIAHEKDFESLEALGLGELLTDFEETQINLFNQYVLSFSDNSLFAQSSRAYNVAIFGDSAERSLFVPGDLSINPKTEIHISELTNILAYWRAGRLKELAFQWFNMGIEINLVECFHNRVIKRNLLNYSSDLHHCEMIVAAFVRAGNEMPTSPAVNDLIERMRTQIDNDPYSLSFSLKILVMITERMLASASCGERLFQRLGSDHQRIIIGEALVEGIITAHSANLASIDLSKKLKNFLKLLVEIDYRNDQRETYMPPKETK